MRSGPIIINIDTALQQAMISISCGSEILGYITNDTQKEHATILHSGIQDLLNENHLKIEEVDAVSVVTGPGSYTGLRVGIASAKGLSYALKKPLISIGTLELMAKCAVDNCSSKDQYYCPMIDARRMEVYTATYNNKLEQIIEPSAIILEKGTMNILHDKPTLYFGDGAKKLSIIDPDALINSFDLTPGIISSMAFVKYESQVFIGAFTLSPLYIKDFFTIKSSYK